MEKRILVTHNGPFHADDLFAYGVLELAFQNHALIRTRDPQIIEKGHIVFDVGGVCDPDRLRYDHHLKPVPSRPDGRLYSSFGLIWHHHGHRFLQRLFVFEQVSDELISAVHERVDRNFVSQIDATDNGIGAEPRGTDAAIFLEAFNPPKKVPQAEEDDLFRQTSRLASKIFQQACIAALRELQAIDLFRATAEKVNEQTLVFTGDSRSDVWVPMLQREPEFAAVRFVIYPDGTKGWRCRAIPTLENSFQPRLPFPAAWAGKRDKALQEISGVATANFCHPACFLAEAKTREDAIKLATTTLAGKE